MASMASCIDAVGAVLDDQPVVVVTGAAGAVGQEILVRLAESGMAVVAVDLNGEGAREALQAADANGIVIEANLKRTDAPSQIMSLIRDRMGRIDYLVNNAGLNLPESIYDIDAANWDEVLAVNLRAPMLLAKMGIEFWERKSGGAIVNIGSRVWLSGSNPAYTSSKAGIVGLTRSLAIELARLNVRTNAVAPGYIDTAFTRMNRSEEDITDRQDNVRRITPLRRLGTAKDIADAVQFLLSPQSSFITGEVLHVCGGAQLAAVSYPFV